MIPPPLSCISLFLLWLSDIASPCLFLTCTQEQMCTCVHTSRKCFTGHCQKPMKGFYGFLFLLLAVLLCWLLRSDLLRPSMKQQSVTVAASSKDHYLLFTFKNFDRSSRKFYFGLQNVCCIPFLDSDGTVAVVSQFICHSSVPPLPLFARLCWYRLLRRVPWVPRPIDCGSN